MAVRGEKASAKFPEPGPDLLTIRLRQAQLIKSVTAKKFKTAFTMHRRQCIEPAAYFEQKHEPVTLALVTMLADETGQVQLRRREGKPQFFLRFPAGTGVGRFAGLGVQLSAAWAPQSAVRFLRAFKQKDFVR